jgi:hypothetical protein
MVIHPHAANRPPTFTLGSEPVGDEPSFAPRRKFDPNGLREARRTRFAAAPAVPNPVGNGSLYS